LHIVHRDVTPENIFVSFDGTVKILDFGIAKAANQIEQTRAGEIKGKLSYMSPEQCLGKPLDCRSDLFSLGVVLYEWITGFKLFTGDSEVAVLKSITEGKIYAPSYFKSDIPEQVEAILMRALEKDREKRYQTAWEFQYDIDQFLSQYEFTPSNIHLSNFLKQLFNDELEEEKVRLAVRPEEAHAAEGEDIISNIEPIPLRPDRSQDATQLGRGQSQPRLVNIPLSNRDVEQLGIIAERNKVTVNDLVRDIVAHWLKYR